MAYLASGTNRFSSASTAVVGNAVYLLVPEGGGVAFLRYSIADDAWTRLPLPAPDASPYRLVAAGAVVIAFAFSDELGAKRDLVFDPVARTWSALPADPLSPGFDREMVWSGGDLYIFDHELVPSPGSDRPSITRAARLTIGSPRWERLPDPEILGTGPWLTDGSKLVSAVAGSADGGEVGNWGRSYSNGGVFDTATSTWSALPTPPTDTIAGAIGARTALFLATEGSLFDTAAGAWITMSAVPGSGRNTDRTVVTAGTDAFAFGGVRQGSGGRSELLGDAWIWRSSRADDRER